MPRTYERGLEMLDGRTKRPWTNQTVLRLVTHPVLRVEVVHHATVIATFFANGAKRFSTGGNVSAATNQRLNAMVPSGVLYRTYKGASEFRIKRGDRVETISANHYDLMVHIDGRLDAVTREN